MQDFTRLPDHPLYQWRTHLRTLVRQGCIVTTTASTYRAGARKFAAWLTASGIRTPSPRDVARFKAHMLKTAQPASVKVWVCGLRAFYAWCVDTGRMPINPAACARGRPRRHGST